MHAEVTGIRDTTSLGAMSKAEAWLCLWLNYDRSCMQEGVYLYGHAFEQADIFFRNCSGSSATHLQVSF